MKKYDVIIIGGGASGMMCAAKAKEKNPDKRIAILEKQSKIGRKLLSTGNGRCNMYNIDADSPEHYHGSFKESLSSMFKACPVDKLANEFKKIGLTVYTDSEGRVYPFSNHASTVLNALHRMLEDLKVDVFCECKVNDVSKNDKLFTVTTDAEQFFCNKLVISTGSCAAPKLGSDKSGLGLLTGLGHKTVPYSPALCSLEVKNHSELNTLKGIRQKGSATLFDGEKYIKTESGEIQFTDKSLSGICVFNLSSLAGKSKFPIVSLNLNPFGDDYGELMYILKMNAAAFKTRNSADYLDGIFVNKLGVAIMKHAGVKDLKKPVSQLTKKEIENICDTITDWKFEVLKPADFDKAQVCSGGVHGEEINPRTMESRKVNGLYICGEAVDVDGDCGGFNLRFAFSSGILAGENI